MAYHGFVKRIQTSPTGRKHKNPSYVNSHRKAFSDGPLYGTTFTERQQAIIRGDNVPNIRKNEISYIINKAEYLGMYEIAEEMYLRYGYMFHQRESGDPTLTEALEILDKLTPDDLK